MTLSSLASATTAECNFNGTALYAFQNPLPGHTVSHKKGNRLVVDPDDQTVRVVSKTFAEVIGERVLRPILDHKLFKPVKYSFRLFGKGIDKLDSVVSKIFPSFPAVAAQSTPCGVNSGQNCRLESYASFEATYTECEKAQANGEWTNVLASAKFLQELRNTRGESLLLVAIKSRKINLPEPSAQPSDESSALVQPLANSLANPLAKSLITHNIAVTSTDPMGNTALHYAAREGDIETFNILLASNKFSINVRNKDGETVLHWAVKYNQKFIVKAILAAGGNCYTPSNFKMDATTFSNVNPLHTAVINGLTTLFDLLVERSPHYFHEVPEIGNLLHISVYFFQNKALSHLLDRHAESVRCLLNMPNNNGQTPLMMAAHMGNIDAIVTLRGKEADFSAVTAKGWTAVHWAALGRQPRALNLLHHYQCNIATTDIDNKTPRSLVEGNSYPDVDTRNCIDNLIAKKAVIDKRPELNKYYAPETLVFKGGGPAGMAYVGSLQEFELMGGRERLIRTAGTSAGAIQACLVALGYDSNDMRTLLQFNFETFLDYQSQTVDLSTYEKFKSNINYLKSAINVVKDPLGATVGYAIEKAIDYLSEIWKFTGFCHGIVFRNWIEELIFKSTNIKNCTFKELRDLIANGKKNSIGREFKHLHVFVTNIAQQSIDQINSEDSKWDHITIASAVTASMAIPGVFKVQKLQFKQNGFLQDSPMGLFCDGGLICNFPINYFDKQKYLGSLVTDKNGEQHALNWRVLGFSLYQPKIKNEDSPPPKETIKVFLDMLQIWYNAEELIRSNTNENQHRVIQIDRKGVSLLEFNLDTATKNILLTSGKNAFKDFYGTQTDYIDPTNIVFPTDKPIVKLKSLESTMLAREQTKKELEKIFLSDNGASDSDIVTKVISGYPLFGASETAHQFAEANLHRFSVVWWVEAGSEESIMESYKLLANVLRIDTDAVQGYEELNKLVEDKLEALSTEKPFLIIFDCAATIPVLPKKGMGRIIITTNKPFPSTKLNSKITQVTLSAFTEDEAIIALKDLKGTEAEKKSLANQLSNYPLALGQAKAYILAKNIGINHYLGELKKVHEHTSKLYDEAFRKWAARMQSTDVDTAAISEQPDEGVFYRKALRDVWEITSSVLDPHTKKAIQICSYLQMDEIPFSLMDHWIEIEFKILSTTERIQKRNDIIRDFSQFRLTGAVSHKQTLSINRGIINIIYNSLTSKDKTELEKGIIAFLNSLNENLDIDNTSIGQTDLWEQWEQGIKRCIGLGFVFKPEDEIRIYETYRLRAEKTGNLAASRQFFSGLLEAKEAKLKEKAETDPSVKPELVMGDLNMHLGKLWMEEPSKAKSFFETACAIYKKILKEEDPKIKMIREDINRAYRKMPFYKKPTHFFSSC
jgi:NTE family protein